MKQITLLGALLALFLVAFPSTSARATQCDPVDVYYEYGGPTGLYVGMDTTTEPAFIIFYTTNNTNPTHTGSTPGSGTLIFYGDIPIPYGQWRHFRAICYKEGYDDSDVAYLDISNPVQ
jgi:Chitobiase/beta-hexosaminidase C-terminal domain